MSHPLPISRLVDQHGRVVKHLRVSVTPRCNFHCHYCDPLGSHHHEPVETLSVAEVQTILRVAKELGVESVRFTGGEPLLRRELPEMLAVAKAMGIADIAITTNGTLLRHRLDELLAAGMTRVNISLDALSPQIFRQTTGGGSLMPVWEGIELLLARNMHPVKINAVMMKGVNEREALPLALLAQELPLHVRFIEYMHLNNAEASAYRARFIAGAEVKANLERHLGAFTPLHTDPSAPARLYQADGFEGALGFINPVSEPFCSSCSRMRVTSDAKLRPCLLNDREFDLRPALQADDPMDAVKEMFLIAAKRKVASGITTPTQRPRTMVAIGG